MASRNSPRSAALVRFGLLAAAGATVLVGAATFFMHGKAPGAQPQLAVGQHDLTIADLINQTGAPDKSDVTGSLPPPKPPKAAKPEIGPRSGLPIPRFVSLKPDKVNVRVGPTRDQSVAFIYQKAGLPVEVTAEFENWRRIRDSEGAEGWVMQSMLSGKRTALVAPWSKDKPLPLYAGADSGRAPIALVESGVMASIKSCSSDWCRIQGGGFDGWIEQNKLWGAYPGEDVE